MSPLSESNQRPTDYKSVALPAELRRLLPLRPSAGRRMVQEGFLVFSVPRTGKQRCKNRLTMVFSKLLPKIPGKPYPKGTGTFFLLFLRYSLGVSATIFLNCLWKWDRLLNPLEKHTCPTSNVPSISNSQA